MFRCSKCNKNHKKHFNNELIKRFENTHELSEEDSMKFCSILQRGIYPCEYMDSWKKIDEILLPEKEKFTVV